MPDLMPPPPQQQDSSKVQRNVARLREALKDTPDGGAAEIERYLRSEGAIPADSMPMAEPADGTSVAPMEKPPLTERMFPWSGERDGSPEPDWNAMENQAKEQALDMTKSFAGTHAAGSAIAGVAKSLARGTGAIAGKIGPNVVDVGMAMMPGTFGRVAKWRLAQRAVKGFENWTKGGKAVKAADPLSKSVASVKASEEAAPNITRLFEQPTSYSSPEWLAAERAREGAEAFARGMTKINPAKPTPPPTFQDMMNQAGQAGKAASQGNAAMARGIEQAAAPPAGSPGLPKLSFEEMMQQAGQAGARGSSGSAAMSRGMEAAATPMKVGPVLPKPGLGAPQLGASVKAPPQPNLPVEAPVTPAVSPVGETAPPVDWLGKIAAQRANQGKAGLMGLGGMMAPEAPAPLSNNVPEAKSMALMGMNMGQPKEALEQQLRSQFDEATVEFVLASLPNRLPQ